VPPAGCYTTVVLGDLYRALPPEGVKIGLLLFLAFLLGLEREEHKTTQPGYSFGGVRTFPLIGLVGYATATASRDQLLPVALGLVAVSGFLWLAYWHKVRSSATCGATSEMSALMTYLVGVLVARNELWIATTLSVAGLFLLELKGPLEGLTERFAPDEILTFTKFLLLTAVILPIIPNRTFGPVQINPFTTWLVVVAVSSVSYGSYVIERLMKGKGGVAMAAILGGAYSSTVTTVVLGRRAAHEDRPHLLSGSTLMASGMMYLRLAVLVGLFNRRLLSILGVPFVAAAALAVGAGWLWSRVPDGHAGEVKREFESRNPLEIKAALLFALLFLAILVVTHLAVAYLGRGGLYALAAVMGVTDVDPFIMGMTQSGGSATPLASAAAAILIAASSNNLVKGVYAYALSDRKTGIMSLALLTVLAVAGLLPLAWVSRWAID
jgi:uncharacterized membrane protein (DUF4010 family)